MAESARKPWSLVSYRKVPSPNPAGAESQSPETGGRAGQGLVPHPAAVEGQGLLVPLHTVILENQQHLPGQMP